MLNTMDQILGVNVIFITNLGRYIKVSSDELEEYQIRRMGKRIGTLRKEEKIVSIMTFMNEITLITNASGYIRLLEESVPNTDKFKLLFTNVKSSPQEVVLYNNKANSEYVLVLEDDKKILFKKELKKCSLEDRIKTSPESDKIIACETLLDIQEKI